MKEAPPRAGWFRTTKHLGWKESTLSHKGDTHVKLLFGFHRVKHEPKSSGLNWKPTKNKILSVGSWYLNIRLAFLMGYG